MVFQKNFIVFIFVFFLSIVSSVAQIPSSIRVKQAIKDTKVDLERLAKSKGLSLGSDVFIRIIKDEDLLELWLKKDNKFVLFKTYEICSYSGGLGPKMKQGDGKSPEGFYFVKPNQLNPWSNFHLAFNIGYPNSYDRAHGYTGNYLMVHGNCCSIGCYAMTNAYIDEIYTIIYSAFEGGQKFFRIHIFPFRMTDKNIQKHKEDYTEYYSFWKNLKQGYDIFELTKLPPNIGLTNKKYSFD